MTNNKYNVGNLVVTAMPGWLDVTHAVEAENPPFTLARNDGVGVIQFTTGNYVQGAIPAVTIESLKQLLSDFAVSRELGIGFDTTSYEDDILVCARSYNSGAQFIRVWYCSNRCDIVLVTYVCQIESEKLELPDCEKTVLDLQFNNRT